MIEVKVVKRCYVCPPKGSVPTTNIPLSFLDMYWIICPPARRFFFYNFPHSTQHFIDNFFPTLQQSLSLTLQHFFPLAGNLILPSQPNDKPYILYTSDDSGDDLPQLIVAVAEPSSNQFEHDYFDILVADYPQTRDAKEFYSLVPNLPKSRVLPDGARAFPLLAIQVTLFPNRGLCICVVFHHAVADGKAAHHFIKSWATASNSTSTPTSASSLPYHDRTTVKHRYGSNIDSIFLRALSSWRSFPIIEKPIKHMAPLNTDRATFVLTKTQIQKLKALVTSPSSLRVSGFIVTCSLIWSCMIKSSITTQETNDRDEIFYLLFVGDCRNRLKEPLPPTYFGNCLDICIVELKKKELLKEDSIVGVVEAIGNKVKELEKEPLKIVEKWFSEWRRCDETKRLITVAGSPKLRVYDTDFGWGRPCKSEILHVDNSKGISLQESRDEEGGIEISLGLTKNRMDRFISIWEHSLKLFCTS
ncbi:coumaroyl-CoA:anthocyanidin 3-O-glucoside-6''-O-coumaroyltransferase 2-like isoform X1 [Cucumis melo var. makuwa]|nr:coumaroyl-CoA:anthocyanidin 3-O-glucoside-6''-O-coumaroyltransferase 2-like isoform X1 [Cucumis melo var. makuwa]TYK29119.1 coumaroyl-CoA:anthocyanidin 3-O-glucoside-6''-O-coumaroyltransferase 2-like isoform X1 [Cucumis melo var. makuwa]